MLTGEQVLGLKLNSKICHINKRGHSTLYYVHVISVIQGQIRLVLRTNDIKDNEGVNHQIEFKASIDQSIDELYLVEEAIPLILNNVYDFLYDIKTKNVTVSLIITETIKLIKKLNPDYNIKKLPFLGKDK